mgnify:CR=1 FL=1
MNSTREQMYPHSVGIDGKVDLSAAWMWCYHNCDYNFMVEFWEARFESREEAMAFQLAMMST